MRKFAAVVLSSLVGLFSAGNAQAFLVEVWDPGVGSITSLAQADSIIGGGAPTTTANWSVIDFDDLGDGTTGHFSLNNAFPGGPSTTFVVRVTGNFFLDAASTVSVNTDDGVRFRIDGALTATRDGVFDNLDTSIAGVSAGLHSIEIVFFENDGGASLEFFRQAGGTGPRELITSVPEPGTLALVGLGGLLFAGVRRRRIR